jgi:hypothetical protein
VIAPQFPSCPGLQRSDKKSKLDTGGLIVLIAKGVQALQYLLDGPLLGSRRPGERERQSDADYPNPNHLCASPLSRRMVQEQKRERITISSRRENIAFATGDKFCSQATW